MEPKQTKGSSLSILFILLTLAICILFWFFEKQTIQNTQTPITETETQEGPSVQTLTELKASIGDIEIPPFHESF